MNNQFLATTKIPINQLSLLILGPTVSTRGSKSHKRRLHASRPTTGRARNKRCRQNIFDPQIFTPDHLRLSRPTTGGARKKHLNNAKNCVKQMPNSDNTHPVI